MNHELEINGLIARRWSPRAFSEQPVDPASLHVLFEAARWAASCNNEQPWRFVVVPRNDSTQEDADAYHKALAVLDDSNQSWAKGAPVLGFSFAKKTFSHGDEKPNKWYMHDTGMALATLMIQATALGLFVHAMAGFNAERAKAAFQVPDHYEPVAAFVIGHLGDASSLPAKYQPLEQKPRLRKPLEEIVFGETFEEAFPF